MSIAERDVLQTRLRELPETIPPRAVWQRIEAQGRAEGLLARSRVLQGAKWVAGAAIAATVALFVLRLPMTPDIGTQPTVFPTEPAYREPTGIEGLQGLSALMVQSQQLERDLRALPAQPQLMRAGTAATILDLEDRVAAIDYVLNDPDLNLSPEQTEAYWRERVRLMNSLLSLRYAQTQRMAF